MQRRSGLWRGCGAHGACVQQWHWSLGGVLVARPRQLELVEVRQSAQGLLARRVGCRPTNPAPSGLRQVAHTRLSTAGDSNRPGRGCLGATSPGRRRRRLPPTAAAVPTLTTTLCAAMSASTFGDFSRERAARAWRLLEESEEHRGSNDVQASKSARRWALWGPRAGHPL